MEKLVILDDRRVLALLKDQSLLAQIPPLADAAKRFEANPKLAGCTPCQQKRLAKLAKQQALSTDTATPEIYTLAQVKRVLAGLPSPYQQILKIRLNTKNYRVRYIRADRKMIDLTV